MRALCLLAPTLLAAVAGSGAPPPSRIVAGRPAHLGQFPHQAYIETDDGGFCGGSLISRTAVLTAAHCVRGYEMFKVWLGGISLYYQETFWTTVSSWAITHPDYESVFEYQYDVAVVFLMEPAPLGRYIWPVSLPSRLEINSSYTGQNAIVSGWGRTSYNSSVSMELKWTHLKVYPNEICALLALSNYDESLMCARDWTSSACHGDSGGALVLRVGRRYKQIGVVSHGIGCESHLPNFFARVTAALDWIRRMADSGL